MSKPPTFPHPSWTNNSFQTDEDVEDIFSYGPGGLHPVVLGDTFNQRYTVVHKLGSGGLATVWLVWDQVDHRYVSLKIMRADQLELSKEVQVHQYLARLDIDLEENFICPLYDNFLHQGPNGSHICLVFPLAGDCVTEEIDRSFPYTKDQQIEQVRNYGRQLAHAVAVLHSVGIAHGDLSQTNVLTQVAKRDYASLDELYKEIGEPERTRGIRQKNIHEPGTLHLVSSADLSELPRTGKILVIDFGEAFLIDHPPLRGIGTPVPYASPEDLYAKVASPANDLWAIGCLLFEWWYGQSLFRGWSRDGISEEWTIILGRLPQAYWSEFKERKKLFDESGKLRRKKTSYLVPDDVNDLADMVNRCWRGISVYDKKKSRFTAHFMPWYPDHWPTPPQIPVSVVTDMTRNHNIVTRIEPDFPGSLSVTTNIGNQSHHLQSGGTPHKIMVKSSTPDASLPTTGPQSFCHSLSRCAPARSPTQLPPGAAEFYCLLKQLLTYDPDQRLPALMILQHHWFSDSPKECESQLAQANQKSTLFAASDSKGNGSESLYFGGPPNTRWSVALDENSQTWQYLRRLEES